MPLRPIDAIFVHLERRLYVVYYRGELWQLPRMKIDKAAWQRKQPYTGSKEALYLRQKQAIDDRFMARKLRTLDLPSAVSGISLPRFEAWWERHGFEWLKERLDRGSSPLAAHQKKTQLPKPTKIANSDDDKDKEKNSNNINNDLKQNNDLNQTNEVVDAISSAEQIDSTDIDIFADMLAELTDEVLNHRR